MIGCRLSNLSCNIFYSSVYKRRVTEPNEFVICLATAKQTLAEEGLERCAMVSTVWVQRWIIRVCVTDKSWHNLR